MFALGSSTPNRRGGWRCVDLQGRASKQEPPLPVAVELAEGVEPNADLAETIRERIRAVLVVQTHVELVPWGSLERSEYKGQLVER